jgi:soluble lytic murein transglycosylase-like protein
LITHRERGPILIAGLIMGSLCVSFRAQAAEAVTTHAYRTSGVVMMIGGMADDSGTQPAQAASTGAASAPDDSGRLSVVIGPASRSPLADATRQTSASIASRVRALSPVIDEAAHLAGVDRALLMAVIDVESGGNPQAISPRGATGLMQLMPDTGQRHGASNLFDPRQNVAAGARYLKALTRQFGELPLALAAYNAGEGAVQKYRGQIPPYAETMRYVPKVIARYEWYRAMTAGDASVLEEKAGPNGRFLLIRSGTGHR